ncbi:DNA translocase FtsK [Flammeovirga aprica]|uniref:DNA translocase FtsK n=1 Tax=Flammeovirga aprica JL-4 TaxID=694437 RepID=A0A7X9NZA3_9BACT|nr:DNA translocase FtsK [Flammeovirga aprica]NME66681.1 DNA translocase FtsK [Flammeovirga aprica JL-4]
MASEAKRNKNIRKNIYKPNATVPSTSATPHEERTERPSRVKMPSMSINSNKLSDPRLKTSIGLSLMFLSVYTFLALFSFIFTGKADQSVIENVGGISNLISSGKEVQNWLGLLGASLSHLLIYNLFGIGTALLIPMLFIGGYELFTLGKGKLIRFRKLSYICIFYMMWTSILLGYFVVVNDSPNFLGFLCGKIGFTVADGLYSLIGWGTVILLILSVLIHTVYITKFKKVNSLIGRVTKNNVEKQSEPTASTTSDEIETQEEEREVEHKEAELTNEADISNDIEEENEAEEIEERDTELENEIVNTILEKDTPSPTEIVPHTPSTPEVVEEKQKNNAPQQIKVDPISVDVNIQVEHVQVGEATPVPPTQNYSENRTQKSKQEPLPPVPPKKEIPASTTKEEETPPSYELEKEDQKSDPIALDPPAPAPKVDKSIDPHELSNVSNTDDVDKADLNIQFEEEEEDDFLQVEDMDEYDPKLDLSHYRHPSLELLNPPVENKAKVTKEELEENKERIVNTLRHFKIGISSISATIGPTVTLYEIVPEVGIKISKIRNLEDDIALSLAALGIRIIAPIPGRGTIGIEVPNSNREMVSISSVLATEKFAKAKMDLPIAFGRTISNEVFVTDLAKMPHVLMAGATGQGKSVGINVLLSSLLYKKHPSELKFVMIDPKKVELSLFNKIERHFLASLPDAEEAIITDTKKAIHILNSLCTEMDMRYSLLKSAGVRNIKEYNAKFNSRRLNPKKGHRFLPYIVLVIDELADLMMTAGKEIEGPIARLAQLARAIGIHLVVATQRPSVDVITGMIKANFPARISFRVTSKIDSRTILDAGGADQLIGMGDMLLSTGNDITRLQCAFIDTDEVEKLCDFIADQTGFATAYMLPEFEEEQSASKDAGGRSVDDRDDLFEEAARLLVRHQQGSTSLIQRKLSLGYNRAGRIIDQLEAAGIVGPFEGSKARQVNVKTEMDLEVLLRTLE